MREEPFDVAREQFPRMSPMIALARKAKEVRDPSSVASDCRARQVPTQAHIANLIE
jgi:hypothetical protein